MLGSFALIFDLTVSGHTIYFLVNNLSRALVDRLTVTFAGEIAQDTDGYDSFQLYEDLFLTYSETASIFREEKCSVVRGSDLKKSLSTIPHSCSLCLVEEKNKFPYWLPWNIDALIDYRARNLIYWDCLEMSGMFVHESLSIFVVRQGLSASFWQLKTLYSSWMLFNAISRHPWS